MQLLNNIKVLAGVLVATAIGSVTFIHFMDDRHSPADTPVRLVQSVEVKMGIKLLMADSTRYAEITKYYMDLQKERPLTPAEQARLDLVTTQQARIREVLLDLTGGPTQP